MDAQTLAQQIALFLTPLLPALVKAASEKAVEEIGKKVGVEAWDKAKILWGKLRPKLDDRPAAQEAVQDVATNPQDEDAQAALRLQLRKLFAEDPAMADEVAHLVQDKVVQRVIARGGSEIEDVEQRAGGGPTEQEVHAEEKSVLKGIKQIRQ